MRSSRCLALLSSGSGGPVRDVLTNEAQHGDPARSPDMASPAAAVDAPPASERRRSPGGLPGFVARHRLLFWSYWSVVVATGTGLVVYGLSDASRRSLIGAHPGAFWMFTAALLAAELRPLPLPRRQGGEITVSWAFSFALLLITSATGAALTVLLATGMADLARRKSLSRVLFNATQIAICIYAAAGLFSAIAPGGSSVPVSGPSLRWLAAATLAASAVFILNGLLTTIVIALATSDRMTASLRTGLLVNLSTDGTLLALAPVLVVVAIDSPLLLPTLLAVAFVVYRSTSLALARKHDAEVDVLTGLANRRSFDSAVLVAQASVAKSGKRLAVLVLDLDGFKAINDRLGHYVGDQVLREFGARLNSMGRAGDTTARLGGDEFAMLASVADHEAAMALADRMARLLDEPCMVEGFPVSVGGSVGVAVYPDHGDTLDDLLHQADAAMYRAKRQRLAYAAPGARSAVSTAQNAAPISRLSLLSDLAGALKNEELVLHYQPKVDIATGRLVGVEALVRWCHPRLGLLAPDAFVPIAEQTELMAPFTSYVLRHALRQCATWANAGLSIPVAVNGSAHNLQDVRFPEEVARLLATAAIDPRLLEVEITEHTMLADPATAATVLAGLRDIGVHLSVDDFGTGYASLTALRDLPVDRIKIDKSFVSSITLDGGDAIIVRSIVELAHNLGLETVAEGVEDAGTLNALEGMGCTTAQGFLIARPAPVEIITPWLERRLERPAAAELQIVTR